MWFVTVTRTSRVGCGWMNRTGFEEHPWNEATHGAGISAPELVSFPFRGLHRQDLSSALCSEEITRQIQGYPASSQPARPLASPLPGGSFQKPFASAVALFPGDLIKRRRG